ncbi:General stress protein 69 [Rubripirellula lacrimiformis]|uniref:General stress protein 69 n=1 Tax=Rubripirellula lacrimiformis TaxID=1930273 RepID=A0A517NG84_9BACT|nr:aldo/keto reductase [Rubripirellula lacrimiformis]QDT06147.1 General stress protein 69 [Rubripirellula lacrimiformis]
MPPTASESIVTFGLWPLAGITTMGVTAQDADDTMAAAIESGITAFDTALSYGFDGESDRLLGRFIRADRDRFTVTGKVGQRWSSDRQRVVDGRPETLAADAETSLRRIGIEQFDVLMLHSPDPAVPLESSAEAMDNLVQRGLAKRTGICNVDVQQLRTFASSAACSAVQCPLNLLQSDSLNELIPTAAELGSEVHVFWALMKGLLAGKISRDHVFAEGDSRSGYEIFQGERRRHAHDVIDAMQPIAESNGCTIAQLSIGWAASQPGVTSVLAGGRRPDQVRELAAAKRLSPEIVDQLNRLVNPA